MNKDVLITLGDIDNPDYFFGEHYRDSDSFKNIIRELTGQEINVRSLKREDFSYIGKWALFRSSQTGGFAYVLGIKGGYKDRKGDPMEIHFHFVRLFANKGYNIRKEDSDKICMGVKNMVVIATQVYAAQHPRTRVFAYPSLEMPEFLEGDLEKLVKN